MVAFSARFLRKSPHLASARAIGWKVNLPNLISLARLLSVPLAVWLIVSGSMATAFWLFVLAGVSDAVDGFIAKRYGCQTTLGSYLDPIADKVLLVSVYLAFGFQGLLPPWLVILVVSRDLLIVGGALLMHTLTLTQPKIAPLLISKLNTFAQILLAAETLARAAGAYPDYGVGVVLIYVVATTTFLSGGAYLWNWARGTRQIERNVS